MWGVQTTLRIFKRGGLGHRLLPVDVHGGAGDGAAFQGFHEIFLVDDGSPGGVHHIGGLLHLGEPVLPPDAV